MVNANPTDLVVFASATAKPGHEALLEQALREAGRATREQPGCVEFTLYRAIGSPATIVGFERWSSPADHERHLTGAHIQKLMTVMSEVLAEPPIIVSSEVLDE